MPKTKKVFPILFSMVLLDQTAFGVLLPIISVLFIEPQSTYFLLSGPAQAQTTGYILLSLLFGTFPLAQFFAGPVLGELSDRFGRKPILIFAALSITVAYGVFAYGIVIKNIQLLFLSRVLAGIGGGSVGVIFASAADISSPADRAKNFGIIASASGLGLILGPLIGGLLSDSSTVSFFNLTTPVYALLILGLCNLLIVSTLFPETYGGRGETQRINWLT